MKTSIFSRLYLHTVIALLLSTLAVAAQSTEEMLEELEKLQREVQHQRAQVQGEVQRRRLELQQELRLLHRVLEDGEPNLEARETVGMMTPQELEAELRILREEIEVLRGQITREAEGAEKEKYVLSGQVRSRFEWNDADFLSGRANLQHLLRSRLALKAAPQRNTRVFIQLQDSRLWGEETSTLTDGSADNIDFHQAYFELHQLFDKPLSVRVGRQELVYGGERLIGAVGWSNIGRSFDAVKLHYGTQSWVDIFNAKLNEKGERDRNFYGLYGHLQAEGHAWEPYLLFEHDKNDLPARLKRFTLGLYGKGKMIGAAGHAFAFELEGAFQGGERGAQDVAAFMLTGSGTYISNHWRKHRIGLGIDLLSGDSDPSGGDYKVFDTLFATNHKFYGYMDYFLNIPLNTRQGGLLDMMLKTGMKLSSEAQINLHLHHFSLAQGAEKALGQEVDAVLKYQHGPAVSIEWGALLFLPGDAMEAIRGGGDPAFKFYWQNAVSF